MPVEVECAWCGEPLIIKDINKIKRNKNHFCNHGKNSCYAKWRSKNTRGSKNPNFKIKIKVSCGWCRKSMAIPTWEFNQSRYKRFFCRDNEGECNNKWRSENIRGQNHSRYIKEKHVIIKCKFCGRDFKVIDRGNKYCSYICKSLDMIKEGRVFRLNRKGKATWFIDGKYRKLMRQMGIEDVEEFKEVMRQDIREGDLTLAEVVKQLKEGGRNERIFTN